MQDDNEWFEEQRPKRWDSFYGRYNQREEHENHQGDDNEWNSGTPSRQNHQSPRRFNQQHQSSNHQSSHQAHHYQTEYQRRQQHPAPIHMFSIEERNMFYLKGYERMPRIFLSDFKEWQFSDPEGSYQVIAPIHFKLMQNYEGTSRYDEYRRGPDMKALLGRTQLEPLSSSKQDDVINWYEDIQSLLETYGITTTPFEDIEISYGAVAFCIPGIGIDKYLEMGRALGKALTSKLLPMKSNANNSELSNLLALVTAN
jgi:hypothetical protein